jgi:hypothetical protein
MEEIAGPWSISVAGAGPLACGSLAGIIKAYRNSIFSPGSLDTSDLQPISTANSEIDLKIHKALGL